MSPYPDEEKSGVEELKSKTRWLVTMRRLNLWVTVVAVIAGGLEWFESVTLSGEGVLPEEFVAVLDGVYINIGYFEIGLFLLTIVPFANFVFPTVLPRKSGREAVPEPTIRRIRMHGKRRPITPRCGSGGLSP